MALPLDLLDLARWAIVVKAAVEVLLAVSSLLHLRPQSAIHAPG